MAPSASTATRPVLLANHSESTATMTSASTAMNANASAIASNVARRGEVAGTDMVVFIGRSAGFLYRRTSPRAPNGVACAAEQRRERYAAGLVGGSRSSGGSAPRSAGGGGPRGVARGGEPDGAGHRLAGA